MNEKLHPSHEEMPPETINYLLRQLLSSNISSMAELELRMKELSAEVKTPFSPWTKAYTEHWSAETDFYKLRDLSVAELAEMTWLAGIDIQNDTLLEIYLQGETTKAARVARTLIKAHPHAEKSIRKGLPKIAKILLDDPIKL